jgi:8-oxo-dGTP diphosphatase
MKTATLCFLIRGNPPSSILLGYKKTGFGQGKLNGIGGKVERGEGIEEAAVREMQEEIGVEVEASDLRRAAQLTFLFPAKPDWDQTVHVFTTDQWKGEPREGREMRPEWFDVSDLPYEKMWADDAHWLPHLLQGECVKGTFKFGVDGETVESFELLPREDRRP